MEGTKPVGLLIDLRRCAGCMRCVTACAAAHGEVLDPRTATDLSIHARTAVRRSSGTWARLMCRHCLEPACASACIVGAIRKDPKGPVLWDEEKCIGCRYCILACPFNVPKYEYDSPAPRVRKCDLCANRLSEGKPPACAEACNRRATTFGAREELLERAKARMARDPEGYDGHVYGELEAGGSSVLYIAPWPVAALGFVPALGTAPLPSLTGRALARVPTIAVCGTVTLAGLYWLIRRRNEVAATEAAARQAARDRLRAERGVPPGGGGEWPGTTRARRSG